MKTLILTLSILSLLNIGNTASAANAPANKNSLTKTDCKKEETYQEISKADLQKLVAEKAVFAIDVNSDESFKEEHVPGAIHFSANEKNFAQVLPKDKNAAIVAYCGGVQCTAWKKAAEKACELGYTNIKHFKEGITGWKKKS